MFEEDGKAVTEDIVDAASEIFETPVVKPGRRRVIEVVGVE